MKGGNQIFTTVQADNARIPFSGIITTIPEVKSAEQTKKIKAITAPSVEVVFRWISYLYWFGIIAFGLNFLLQLVVLLYTAYSKPFIQDGSFRIVELSGEKAPCSFFNFIFINPEKYDWETYNQVLEHEKIHAIQKHSMDILIAEITLTFQWFNPFAWLYRKELENNLEYLTDEVLLHGNENNKGLYQESLLKVAVPQLALRLTASYNQSLLKKRLVRMDGKKSNLHTLWKYAFLLPLCLLLVCAFNVPEREEKGTPGAFGSSNLSGQLVPIKGMWYASRKGNEVDFYLRSINANGKSSSQLTVANSLMVDFIQGKSDTFRLSREAGSIIFKGEFENGKGLGEYQFEPDKKYQQYMSGYGISDFDVDMQLAFFLCDITKGYVSSVIGPRNSKTFGKELLSRRLEEIRNRETPPKYAPGRKRIGADSDKVLISESIAANLQKKPLSDDPEIAASIKADPKVLIDPNTVRKLREEAMKRALSNMELTEADKQEAEKATRLKWRSDSIAKKGKSAVAIPVVIKVETKAEQ